VINNFKDFVSLALTNASQTEIDLVANCLYSTEFKDFVESLDSLLGPTPDISTMYAPSVSGYDPILVPKSWILDNKPVYLEYTKYSYFAFGGNTWFTDDKANSLSKAYREAGVMAFFNLAELLRPIESSFLSQYDFNGTNLPAYMAANHLGIDSYGPLKRDWTKLCPLNLTMVERDIQCVSPQEAIYGSENLKRLEDIKNAVDPTMMFDCVRCIGNSPKYDGEETLEPSAMSSTKIKFSSCYAEGTTSLIGMSLLALLVYVAA